MIAGNNRRYSQQGFSLLEVLIAAVILAVSLLGLISLQSFSYYTTYESRQNVQAIYAAQDMVERLRLNRAAWLNSHLASPSSTYSASVGTDQSVLSAPSCMVSSSGEMSCDGDSDKISYDLFVWQSQLSGSSVSGNNSFIKPVGCIELVRDSNSTKSASLISAKVIVSWQDKEDASDASKANGNSCGVTGARNRQLVVSTLL